jgi:hypothetical protein
MLGMLTAAAAAVVLSGAAPQPAAAAAAVSSSNALEEYMKLEDAGKLRDQRSLENIRCVGLMQLKPYSTACNYEPTLDASPGC